MDEDLRTRVRREAQQVVDAEIAAAAQLKAAIDARVAKRAEIADADAEALKFIDDFANPKSPNPAPIAPDVAATPPANDVPVFTTVESTELTPETTSGGGTIADIAPEFVIPDA